MITPVKVATSGSAAASARVVVEVGATDEPVARSEREDDLGVRRREADDALGQRLDDDLGALVVDDRERERGLIRAEGGDGQADEAREDEPAEAEGKTRPPGTSSGGRIDRSGRDHGAFPFLSKGWCTIRIPATGLPTRSRWSP